MCTYRKGSIKNKVKFSTLFKHLLNIRAEDYDSEDNKVITLIFSYHIYSTDYEISNINNDLDILNNDETSKDKKENIIYKEDPKTNIKYMDPLKIFKLPIIFAGGNIFNRDFLKLNSNTSDISITTEYRIKYLIRYNNISPIETEVIISIQEDPSIIIYRFKDKLIVLPKLDKNEILFERTIMSKSREVYIIDSLTKEIILVKKVNINKSKGYINRLKIDENFKIDNLDKYITFDIEAITDLGSLDQNGKATLFDPIMISAYDFYNKNLYCEILNEKWKIRDKVSTNLIDSKLFKNEPLNNEEELRLNRINSIKNFFIEFIQPKYHKFVLYAHNLSGFDGVLILESLVYLSEDYGFKIEPLIKENKIISIKIRFGKTRDQRYRYHIIFHDSLLILLSSLEKLCKTILKDHPDMHKIDNEIVKSALLFEEDRKDIDKIEFLKDLQLYCERDSVSLALIINMYSNIVYDEFKLNVHKYPTASSLALAIYRSRYLESDDLIPLISGEIYRDISKAYHGGHTEVYKLYSDKPVHSYDYVSMYPSQMLQKYMPVGKITKFIGNPLLTGETLESLSDKLAFIKCSVYVDKSLKRPVYQTIVNVNGELRSMCATGTFLNQWVYVPELLKYQEKTNGKISIITDSIHMGYLFNKKIIFKDFIEHLFTLRKSVSKNHPLNQICKITMNSLYGRMGLRQELTEYKFMNTFEIEKFSMKDNVRIKDIVEFSESLKSLVITIKNSDEINLKSSVPIASAITAYARMELNELILDQDLDILYVDTDSFKCHQKITELDKYKHLSHDNLGGLKYEETYSESLFLLPKVYGGIIDGTDSEFTKVKGFKDKVEFNQLKHLLLKNKKLELSQNKWRRDMLKSEIKIMKSPYILILNENKRIIDINTMTTKPYHFECYDPEAKENIIK